VNRTAIVLGVALASLAGSAGCANDGYLIEGEAGGDSGAGTDGSLTDAADATMPPTDASDASDSTNAADASDATDGGEPTYLLTDSTSGFAYTASLGSPYDSILAAPLDTMQSALAPGFATGSVLAPIVAPQKFQLIASSADLYAALDISASLGVSPGLASVNAKTAFVKGTGLDSTDLWVLADFSQMAATQKAVSPTLSAQAAALGPDQFYAQYGDRYAAEIEIGAEMFCAVRIPTSSQKDKSDLTAALGFAYGTSSVSSTFASAAPNATNGRNIAVSCGYLGFAPKAAVTDLPTVLAFATAFQSGDAASLGTVSTSTLALLYTSYYGMPGYPGVPAGAAARVAQQGPLASDFLLYDSLVTHDFAAYYADSTVSGVAFLAHMKAYRDGLSTFLTSSIASSLNPSAAPTSFADGVITDWLPTKTLSSMAGTTPQFEAYGMQAGVVPKRFSDYTIPLRYAYPDASGHGTLKGVTFAPVSPVPWATSVSSKQPVDYPLYLVNVPGAGGGLRLEYQWDTGTYGFPNVTNAQGAPDPTMIASAITGFALSGNLMASYVVVSKANGLAMTDNGGSGMTATHFAPTNKSQLWEFYLDAGNVDRNCGTYVAPGGPAGNGCATTNNVVTSVSGNPPCGSLLYAISLAAIGNGNPGYWQINGGVGSAVISGGGGGCSDCDWGCGVFPAVPIPCANTNCGGGPVPTDDFFLEPYDKGSTQAIYNYAGSQGGAVSFVVTDPTATSANLPPAVGSGSEPIVVGPDNGNANALWVFIQSTNVDTSP
jgi:hypothetical protein